MILLATSRVVQVEEKVCFHSFHGRATCSAFAIDHLADHLYFGLVDDAIFQDSGLQRGEHESVEGVRRALPGSRDIDE